MVLSKILNSADEEKKLKRWKIIYRNKNLVFEAAVHKNSFRYCKLGGPVCIRAKHQWHLVYIISCHHAVVTYIITLHWFLRVVLFKLFSYDGHSNLKTWKWKKKMKYCIVCSNMWTSLKSLLKATRSSSYQYKWPICYLYANTWRVLTNKHNTRALLPRKTIECR